jgi:NTP pyrophosphatase (non-canonical NTP hydrolase)
MDKPGLVLNVSCVHCKTKFEVHGNDDIILGDGNSAIEAVRKAALNVKVDLKDKTVEVDLPELTMNEYQKKAMETAVYPKDVAFYYLTMKLAGEAGEVCEKIGKVVRDRGVAKFSESEKREIAKELGDVLWYVSGLSYELGFSLEQVAKMNRAKLKDRAERGVLKSSGDNR